MVLLPDIRNENDIEVVARRVNESLSRPIRVGGREICVTASIGISTFPLDGSDPQLLLERAEVAMNHVKRGVSGRFQFYGDNLNARSQARLSIENELRAALERDPLEVHYQPKIDIQQNRVAGVEALVRMPRADAREMGPDEFIPIAEDTGLIAPLGPWVFRNACEEFAKIEAP
jgi:predicted signal transduction protein with EAL and GGDEF domain